MYIRSYNFVWYYSTIAEKNVKVLSEWEMMFFVIKVIYMSLILIV